jgi:predicted DsbA family dithiol-disulfide isomerase
MSRRLTFSYWSDPLCIWAFVAQSKLDRILEAHGDRLEVAYRIVPVFGSVPQRFAQGPWAKEGVQGRVAATARIAREHGHPEVSGEIWLSDPPSSSWAAGAALKAVFTLEAKERLPQGTAAEYQWQMRRRFFVDNRNVARRHEQLALAEALSVPRAELEALLDDGSALSALWEDYADKETLRIQGSPTYVFEGGRAQLYGNFAFGILSATVDELLRGMGVGSSAC